MRQVQAAFEALLDILELQSQLMGTQAAAPDLQAYLQTTASTLLALGEPLCTLALSQFAVCSVPS